MSAPRYTPGPWRAEYPGPDVFAGDQLIASLVVERDEPEDRAQANARLIAAAPMLLEALKAADNIAHGEFCGCGDPGGSSCDGPSWRLVIAAAEVKS